MKLTETQKDIVQWKDGNLLVTAAPGSGKTFVFTSRIAYLIRKYGVNPSRILALTFTKNAAEQMRTRLADLVGVNIAKNVHMSTFHSFAYSQLKNLQPYKYANKPIVADWFKIRTLYDVAGKKTSGNPHGHNLRMGAPSLSMFISYQKANLVQENDPVLIDENTPYAKDDSRFNLQSAYDTYCKIIRNSNSMEFDDMIMDFAIQLDDQEFCQKIKDQFDYILVDEFQDTATSNNFILQKICDDNLMVVGDVNQSLYSFINADIDMILDFSKNFNNVTTRRLDQNYRSCKSIVDISNKIIMSTNDENLKQYAYQEAVNQHQTIEPVRFVTYKNEFEEVYGVTEKIFGILEEDSSTSYEDFAVISRTNAYLGMFESEFAYKNIPVNISGGRSFFDRKEIIDLLSYAKHSLDRSDDMSLRRVFNAPNRFISKKTMADLDAYAYNNKLTLEMAIDSFDGLGKSATNIYKLRSLFANLEELVEGNASKFLKKVYYDTDYEQHIRKTSKTAIDLSSKLESIEKLFDIAKKFNNIKSFLGHVSVIKDNNKKKDGINLMTAHAAKGLEFNYVFGVGINDESYPHEMSYNYEEERRVLYVLVSRAIRFLQLSSYVFKGTSKVVSPSDFLIDAFGEREVRSSFNNVLTNGFTSDSLIIN